MSKAMHKPKLDPIVLDAAKGLVFQTEDDLYNHFASDIESLESEFAKLRSSGDIPEKDFRRYEDQLAQTLDSPDEVWRDTDRLPGVELNVFIKEFTPETGEPLYYVALAYLTQKIPSFIYLHFPTTDLDLVERYQMGELIYDKAWENAPQGALEGDALLEGEELAIGLYEAMLKVRAETDISEPQFREYSHLREESIEDADEIWRSTDTFGNVLVNFIKEFSLDGGELVYYVVSTVEDLPSNSHALLFSFPTNDKTLVDRYRHGENLQADEVVQESSH